jgi:hypothetical protein
VSQPEHGSITLWLAVLATGLFATVGLVTSGGAAMAAHARAESQAFAAARAGAEALSAGSLATGTPTLDVNAARDAASRSLAADGAAGEIGVAGRTVSVTVRAQVPGGLLALVGIHALDVAGSARATATPGP